MLAAAIRIDQSSRQRKVFTFAEPEDDIVIEAYRSELKLARLALECRNFARCFFHLERAHVLAQRMTGKHARVHWLMLVAALHQRDYREAAGQIPRLIASLLFSRIWVPAGNTGRARVSALRPMPIPSDLRHLIS